MISATSAPGLRGRGRPGDLDVAEIKRRVDIGVVIGRYVKLKRRGKNLVGLCPFHREKTPSFNVRPDKGFFKCFGCDKKGDVFTFLQEITGKPFAVVVEDLRAELGGARERAPHPVEPPPPQPPASRPDVSDERQRADLARRIAAAAELESIDPRAQDYLKTRGIPPGLVESGFGYLDVAMARKADFPGWVIAFLEEHGPAVVAPLRTPEQRVRAVHLRAIKGGERRTTGVLIDDDGTPVAYGWAGACLRAEVLILCEGMADTWAAEAMTRHDPQLVAIGAHDAGALVAWARWLAAHGTSLRRVVVVRHLDGLEEDGAGQTHADEAVATFLEAGVPAEHFDWVSFLEALHGGGVDAYALIDHGKVDLADTLEVAPWERVQGAFLRALEDDAEKTKPPTGIPPSAAETMTKNPAPSTRHR